MNIQLKLAVDKFNDRKFFECHDILEDYWFECKQEEKDFYQGLLHFAVAFHQLIDKKNPQGAKLQFRKCINKLNSYDKNFKGIDINKILGTCTNTLKKIETGRTNNIKIPNIKIFKEITSI